MRLRVSKPEFSSLPQPGERVRLRDGRIARVVKLTTRWEEQDFVDKPKPRARLLMAELGLVPDGDSS